VITRFRILGPLEVRTGKEWVSLNAPEWRIVLATLLLQPREMVPAARLVDELWPGNPPGGARKLVSLYVMRVRRVLGDRDGSVLVTRPPGYQLWWHARTSAARYRGVPAAATGMRTAISPPSRNPADRSRLSPLQKLPGSYQLGRRSLGSRPMAW
jgi:DNA-binding SARP family transcriptional activator